MNKINIYINGWIFVAFINIYVFFWNAYAIIEREKLEIPIDCGLGKIN